MSLAPHVLVETELGGRADDVIAVPATTLHHLRRVLRLLDGASLSLTDGRGSVADAVLAGDGARRVGPVRTLVRSAPRLTLAQALSKGRRAEDAVRVACELGVDRIAPVVASRTQGRPDARAAEALVTRWDAVAVAALEQSRGAWRAAVDAPLTVDALGRDAASAVRFVAVPGAAPLPEALRGMPDVRPDASAAEVVVAVGPEGGWTDEEVALLVAAGWRAVGLGPSVLRTEHAGPVAIAVLAALLGRWDSPTGSAAMTGAPGTTGAGGTLPGPSVEEHRHPVSGPQ